MVREFPGAGPRELSLPAGRAGGGGGIASVHSGFKNIGNTCYMNAVLSSFLGLPPFVSDVVSLLPLFQPVLGASSIAVTPVRFSV